MDQRTERLTPIQRNGQPITYRISDRYTADGVPFVQLRQPHRRDVEIVRPVWTGFLFGFGMVLAWLTFGALATLVAAL